MKPFRKTFNVAVAIVLSLTAMANDTEQEKTNTESKSTFTVGGQYKPRFEFRNGYKRPILENHNPAYFVEQRTRLWVDYTTNKFQIHINLQDVRMWGATNQIYKSDGTANGSLTNVYEAYGAYYFNDKWTLKLGRQELDYDNARFLGNLDWAMQGRSHDGLVLMYQNNEGFQLHIGGALNQFQTEPTYLVAAPYTNNNYKNMAFIWANKAWENFNLSFLFHNDGREAVNVDGNGNPIYTGVEFHRQTMALIPTYNTDAFKVGGELYYQFGKNGGGTDVSAYFANVFFTLKTKLTPVTIGGEVASGTQLNDTQDNSWNPLYGTNHKFYGYMDYFYVGNSHGQSALGASGLINVFLKFNFKLAEQQSLTANVHYFASPVTIVNLNNGRNMSSALGTEIDLIYKVVLTKGVAAFAAYSHMFATETMNHIKPTNGQALSNVGGLQNWFWLGMNFSGDLFHFSK